MTKTRICVTGGSGGAGHAVIKHLLDHGYDCLNVDIHPPRAALCPFKKVDMRDYRAVFEAFEGCDAVVHYAGNPHPDADHWTGAARFAQNTTALFNAFNAAAARGIKRVVWASSETIFGFPFDTNRPPHIPLTEADTPAPQNAYAMSKSASEHMAALMADLHGMTFIGLRLSNVLYDDPQAEASFQKIPGYWEDPASRKFNLWGYIDARDAAEAVRLSLTCALTGAEVFSIAAADTIMRQDNAELLASVMPGVPMKPGMGPRQAMIDCSKARRMLGWTPQYTWQNVLGLTEDGRPLAEPESQRRAS